MALKIFFNTVDFFFFFETYCHAIGNVLHIKIVKFLPCAQSTVKTITKKCPSKRINMWFVTKSQSRWFESFFERSFKKFQLFLKSKNFRLVSGKIFLAKFFGFSFFPQQKISPALPNQFFSDFLHPLLRYTLRIFVEEEICRIYQTLIRFIDGDQ